MSTGERGVDSGREGHTLSRAMGRILTAIDRGLHGYERLGAWIITTAFIVAPIAAAVYWLRHHHVPAWVPVAVGVPLLVFAFIAFALGRTTRAASGGPRPRERQLERELERAKGQVQEASEAAAAEYKPIVARAEYEKRLLTEALESVQHAVGAEEDWDIDALVERGILGPARGLLVRAAEEDVRLAVLVPADEPPERWAMRWAAGHRPESVKNYHHQIDQTLAGIAFRQGDYVDRPDVQADQDFVPNPKETRPFAALVAVPLRVEERIVGVLSVVSTVTNAFREPDVSFIKAIGALLDVVLASEHDAERWAAALEDVQRGPEDEEKGGEA